MSRIKVLLVLLAALVIGSFDTPARASGTLTVNGRWAGVAFANDNFDLNGDGVPGRQTEVHAYDQLPFSNIEAVLDSALVSVGVCAGPGSLLLHPLGRITFRGRLGDSLFADPDPTAPDLCFDPANPAEVLQVVLVGGTGLFANATGTGTLNIHDTVRISRIVNVPGVGPVPAPTMIDSHGEFTLRIQ